MKILFLHVPKSASKPSIKFVSSGTIALANYLKEKGHDCLIVNSYVEKEIDSGFDAVDFIKKEGFKLICIPLHWHFQTYDVLETAKRIKKEVKGCRIVLGGFTASYFAEDILKEYKFVDFVIRGDAQKPLLDLVEKKLFKDIDNLVWRDEKGVKMNRLGFSVDSEMLNELDFADFSLIKNFEKYKRLGLPTEDKKNKWLFVYNPGIGCNTNCTYCGGSCSSQKKINGRGKAIFADIERAVYELKRLAKHSMGVWYVTFDPEPKSDYYLRLFERLREERIKVRCKFEAWGLPSLKFVEEFAKTFEKGSEILLSPETGSEKVRKLNKGFYYSNKDFISVMKKIEEKGLGSTVYFTAGLVGEKMKDFIETVKLANEVRMGFKNAAIYGVPIEIEPASPMFEGKVKSGRKSIKDFYKAHKKQSGIGYHTDNFSEQDILELVNLLRVVGECRMKRPVFLKAMAEAPFPFDDFPKNELHKFCMICRFYDDCFA